MFRSSELHGSCVEIHFSSHLFASERADGDPVEGSMGISESSK